MTRRILSLVLAISLVFLFSGCGLIWRGQIASQYRAAEKENTEEAYEQFIRQYNGARFTGQTVVKAFEKLRALRWERVQREDSIEALEEFLVKNPKDEHVSEVREKLRIKYEMAKGEVDEIYSDSGIDLSKDKISQLVIAGAECLDSSASWIYPEKGRKVYEILKRTASHEVVASLGRVVMTNIDRKSVLFLAVKLGISGTEHTLNGLLMRYGDKSMAEDFLNCGSRLLAEGGRKWAKARGYRISTGFGSHKVSWGHF